MDFTRTLGTDFIVPILKNKQKRWAATRGKQHIVNVYSYVEDKNLNILKFDNMTEEWLDFVIDCRKGIEHEHDIVGGPMADDTIWDYIEDFIDGKITREAFWVLVKFKYPTHQIVFTTDRALKTIHFERSYEI